jgi:hypothetical protein
MSPKMRTARGRFTISEEISRDEAWERLTGMLKGKGCWLLPYLNFEPVNTDSLRANVRLEAEGSSHTKYPSELTVWDVEKKRFVFKIMYGKNSFTEYDFSVNYFMNGGTFIDARLVTNGTYRLGQHIFGGAETATEQLERTMSYIPIKGRIDFAKAE